MPFKPPNQQPQFADLKTILSQYKKADPALFKTLQVLIDRLSQYKDVTNERIDKKQDSEAAIGTFASKNATFLTKADETSDLPNSVQLLAGSGIIFDDSVPNKRTINTAVLHYDAPLSDGDLIAADLIYAAGECIIVQVPL